MDVRKIIQIGRSSYVISLPKDWLKENNLGKGDLVFLARKFDGLLLLPRKEPQRKERKVVINIDGKDRATIARELITAYLNDFSTFVVEGEQIKQSEPWVKGTLNNLIGIEIIEQNPKQIIAKDVLSIAQTPLRELLRRTNNLILGMFLELKKPRKNELKQIDEEVNKLCFLVFKILKRCCEDGSTLHALNITMPEVLKFWDLTQNLERIADELKALDRLVLALNAKERQEYERLCLALENLYLTTLRAFYKRDKVLAKNTSKKGLEFTKSCDSLKGSTELIRLAEAFKKIEYLIYQINKIVINE